jgi:putative CocE/NonD family hydrolase
VTAPFEVAEAPGMLPVRPVARATLTLSDGVALEADIWRPDAPGRFPVLLMRHAYGRTIASSLCYAHPAWYAAHGYIVVIQDVRGRGESGGAFRLFEDEAADGAATVAWAAALDGSNGTVGMFGFSYQGSNQLLAAAEAGGALGAVAPAMIGWDIHADWATENGATGLEGNLRWAAQMAAEAARRAADVPAYGALRAAAQALDTEGPNPARPEVMRRYAQYSHYHDWLDHPAGDAYWRRISPSARVVALRARGLPMLFIGGFYDSHLPGTLAAWEALHAAAPCALVVGPWAHFPWQRRVGEVDFGAEAEGDIDARQVAFFDRWLKGRPADAPAPVRLFDMGLGLWRDLPSLPTPNREFFTGSGGRAAIDLRDGTLIAGRGGEGSDYLVHDPWRPVPTRGGCLGVPAGPLDRAAIDARPEVLTFTKPAATAEYTLAGRVAATVAFQTDAASIDLHCVLSRITPEGRVLPLCEGYATVADAAAGAVRIPMRATCATIRPGEALRLSIAGACFPAFPINPGNGVRPCDSRLIDARPIAIRIHHGDGGTRLHLPILTA